MAVFGETNEGSWVNDAFDRLKQAYTGTLPAHVQALNQLASRPIQG